MKVALLGVGHWHARMHLDAVTSSGGEVTTVWDPDTAAAKRFAADHGLATAQSLEQAIDDCPDLVVLMVAEDCTASGEGVSRADLGLSGVQREMLDALVGAGKPIVLVIDTGRPLALTAASGKVAALMISWHPGTEGRTALAEILTGRFAPSGKLPMTFPRSVGQIPISYNDLPTSRPFNPKRRGIGDRYTTGYVDEAPTPLYPFGRREPAE